MTLAVWTMLILAVVATAVVVYASWRHGVEMTELGTVSQNWLSEQRAHDRHYSER
jgi:Tfp pilus assembly protein PilE